ncbi:MAG: acyl-CoA dehydrogenase family protein [Deltaproteobacteria bacterium]|nr:acyl-CoA dehydrogenase family protein [Deltaproteobacteria bacterium]
MSRREIDCWSRMEPPEGDLLAVPWARAEEADTLDLVLAQTRRFLLREVDPVAIDEAHRIPDSVREAASALGLFALTIPEWAGGLGLTLQAASRVVEEIALVDRSVAVMVGLHSGLGTRGLIDAGSDASRARWLPSMAAGERVGAFAATEPSAGSDLMAVSTCAVPDGSFFRVTGEKCFVTNAAFAGLFTVLARTPGLAGGKSHTLLCIPRDAEGLSVCGEEHKLGIRGSSTGTVRFDDVRVPECDVLGTVGGGLERAHDVLGWGRTLLSAGCVGTARAALEATLEHVQRRRQFGKPIGEQTLVRNQVADMAATVFTMESLVRWAGVSEHRARGLGAPSLIAKVFCSEGAFAVCDQAIQLHGALGFLEPTGIARMLRDCRVTRIFEGANDVLLVRHGAALAASSGAPPPPSLVGRVPLDLQDVAGRWHAAALEVRTAIADARRDHGLAVVGRQLVLEALARADVDLRAAAAALSRGAADPSTRALAEHAGEVLIQRALDRLQGPLARARATERRVTALAESLYGARPERTQVSSREVRVSS